MLKVGLTGNIACGKSSISNILQLNDYYIIDADVISREIYEYDDVMERMRIYFPQAIIENQIDRKKLSDIVFGDNDKLLKLNRIVHDKINSVINMRINLYKKMYGEDIIVIIDAALLFESNFDKNMDKIVVVFCPEDEQLIRLMDREGITVPQALSRINSQMDQSEKVSRADYVIDNSGNLEDLEKQVNNLMQQMQTWNNNFK
ncbi:dephospho-CoA kinase [Peptostreptococcus equinus]|uniref:Dephospho-CoA kinase n=1 Tax=Peptostreptococcus equinus TaxID=3003601 RepID=A0ABY7JLT2_9FIRM|nr:dephospho-CoA kinase [Peptostreptococcus sp. CBA3647]WAW14321.1 dephospho-CoA kinase [Peptostreptococcus sp. CBA3647]